MPVPLSDRLEMLLTAEWLASGAPDDGAVAFTPVVAARELGLEDDRSGILEVMGALTELEESRRLRVEWARVPGAPARVELADALRRDVRRALEPPPN
jgi:hypothetical protein